MNFSQSGSNISPWALVSDILAEEVNLQQDLDGDGHVGTPPIAPPESIAGKAYQLVLVVTVLFQFPLQLSLVIRPTTKDSLAAY